jgi:hypothetical protein
MASSIKSGGYITKICLGVISCRSRSFDISTKDPAQHDHAYDIQRISGACVLGRDIQELVIYIAFLVPRATKDPNEHDHIAGTR